jgi:hypothetical protein
MAYIQGEVTALITAIDAQDDGITAALAAAKLARVLLFPELASTEVAANIAGAQAPHYVQGITPGSQLSSALTTLKDSLAAAITGFETILAARAAVTGP